jgi:hypothetical protein
VVHAYTFVHYVYSLHVSLRAGLIECMCVWVWVYGVYVCVCMAYGVERKGVWGRKGRRVFSRSRSSRRQEEQIKRQ